LSRFGGGRSAGQEERGEERQCESGGFQHGGEEPTPPPRYNPSYAADRPRPARTRPRRSAPLAGAHGRRDRPRFPPHRAADRRRGCRLHGVHLLPGHRLREQTHPRADGLQPGGAAAGDPDLWLGRGRHARGGAGRPGVGGRHLRHQHGLPGEQGAQGVRRRRPDGRSEARGANHQDLPRRADDPPDRQVPPRPRRQ